MGFTTVRPAYPLSNYVDFLWSEIGQTTYEQEKVLPNGAVTILLNLGSPHRVATRARPKDFTLHKGAWIHGIQTDYILLEAVAETVMMGATFKPGGVHAFFGFPTHELRNITVDLELVWGRFADEVREQLAAVPTLAQRFRRLEQLLLTRLWGEDPGWAAIQYAVAELMRPDQTTAVGALSNEMGISQKHLIHQFKSTVGVPPKTFARIARFNQILHAVDPAQPLNWTEIAHACHYYDQAHFNRDFKRFSGLTPSEYLAQRKRHYGAEVLQGESVHFVPVG